jgi:CheY-like chemotaxis protein
MGILARAAAIWVSWQPGRLAADGTGFRTARYVAGIRLMSKSSAATPRVLVVEDEYLIRMLLEDMLADLGYEIAGAVGTIAEASDIAANANFDLAVLDVNLDGQEIYPVADILAKRGLPFVFVSGYGESSLPDPYRGRPCLQKPFQAEALKTTLAKLLATA